LGFRRIGVTIWIDEGVTASDEEPGQRVAGGGGNRKACRWMECSEGDGEGSRVGHQRSAVAQVKQREDRASATTKAHEEARAVLAHQTIESHQRILSNINQHACIDRDDTRDLYPSFHFLDVVLLFLRLLLLLLILHWSSVPVVHLSIRRCCRSLYSTPFLHSVTRVR
jgi:hypothetical protein